MLSASSETVAVCAAVMVVDHTTVRAPAGGVSLTIWNFTSSATGPSFSMVPVTRTVVVATRVPFARVSAEVVVQVGAMPPASRWSTPKL
jgi:hypothetical protein